MNYYVRDKFFRFNLEPQVSKNEKLFLTKNNFFEFFAVKLSYLVNKNSYEEDHLDSFRQTIFSKINKRLLLPKFLIKLTNNNSSVLLTKLNILKFFFRKNQVSTKIVNFYIYNKNFLKKRKIIDVSRIN